MPGRGGRDPCAMTGDRYAVHRLGDEGFTPPRLRLGIEAFGVTVRRAGAGEQIVAERSEEGEDGNEELYVALPGAAEFVVGGETVSLPTGGCLAVAPLAARRTPPTGGSSAMTRSRSRRVTTSPARAAYRNGGVPAVAARAGADRQRSRLDPRRPAVPGGAGLAPQAGLRSRSDRGHARAGRWTRPVPAGGRAAGTRPRMNRGCPAA